MQVGLFTSEQILAVLAEAEQGEASMSALCRKHNINRITFYRWRKQYGGEVRPRAATGSGGAGGPGGRAERDLARENAQLKRLLAERDLEVDLLKQALGKKW
jgi:putative transposase